MPADVADEVAAIGCEAHERVHVSLAVGASNRTFPEIHDLRGEVKSDRIGSISPSDVPHLNGVVLKLWESEGRDKDIEGHRGMPSELRAVWDL